jgi:hypothetical protein
MNIILCNTIQYCFVTGTYTVQNLSPNQLYAHPFVGNYVAGENTQKFHHYFQWVPFILFIQGILFYFPNVFWKFCERQKLAKFLNQMDTKHKNAGAYINTCKYLIVIVFLMLLSI